jgi:hypothetical protein
VVILDDDPRYYGGAARNTASGARREDIRMAARIPLMSLSTYGDTVRRAVGLGEAGLAGARAYTDAAVAVSLPGGDRVGLHGDVTVRVTYQMHCGVPLARWLLCHSSGPAGRATRIRAEATLPNQGARYAY